MRCWIFVYLTCLAAFAHASNATASDPATGCSCVIKNDCGCCLDLHPLIPSIIKQQESVCLNATYLPEDYGVRLTWTFGNYTLVNSSVSLRNPPPICIAVPYTKHALAFCVTLFDITLTTEKFHLCSNISIGIPIIIHENYPLGCANIALRAHKEEKASLGQRMATFAPTWLLVTGIFLIATILSITGIIITYNKIRSQSPRIKCRNDYVVI